ncbi:MAG TPA: M23 family metallopeptidase, partial [Candidatus Polarisedimenticolia bacterium]|nr:M23 family metallopeptidase [Candidatus Polarisedimenticolia bacterium]
LALLAAVTSGAATRAPAGRVAKARAPQGALPWPIDRTPAVVSTFGEYRYDHLHAGIDISTGGSIGVPVHAVADGAIYRLKVEWRGYGRALYLKHDRGDSSVYGHLDAYEEKTLHLETLVAKRRREAGTPWPGDILLEPPVRVRRGQVIAFSGESGVGPPHLHFEMRGAQDNPIDPFRHGVTPPADRNPPDLDALLVTAAGPSVVIDGGTRERSLALTRRGGIFEAPATLGVDGPILLTLLAWDPTGEGRAGLASLALALDGRPCFKVAVESFRFDQYPVAGLLFDHRVSRMGPMRMGFRLAPLPGNVFAEGACGGTGGPPGSIDLTPGDHRFEVSARDASGLESRARFTVRRGSPPPARVDAAEGPIAAVAPAGDRAQGSAALRFFPGFLEVDFSGDGTPPALDRCPAPLDATGWRRLDGDGVNAIALNYPTAAALGAAAESGRVDAACPLLGLLDPIRIAWIEPGQALRREIAEARIDIPAGGRFFAGPLVLRRVDPPDPPEGLRPVSGAIDLLPPGEALDARGTVAFRIDPASGDPRRLGVYRFDDTARRWGFEGDDSEPAAGTIGVAFRRYGRFALFSDESAPEILEVHPKGGMTGRRPAITARVREVGKGLSWDGVRLTLDGKALPAEFDPDRGQARPFEAPTLEPGRHRLLVEAVDRAGNAAEPVTVEFSVR